MAPNGHASGDSQAVDHPPQVSSRPVWHERHGSAEFKNWQKENPTQHISYNDWKNSKHVEGLSLYYAALRIWEESDSSDEEVERFKVESRPRGVRGQSAREPKKTLKTNGHGLPRSVGSATPSGTPHSEDLSPSSKKKRKARKKYLSQELVASEESEEIETATPLAEGASPSAPIITVNGRRKSSNRKPKKKPISEETISPEDEEDDPMEMNGIVTPAIASPLPVRSAPKAPTAMQTSQPPKKTILKLSTRRAPKKKVLSEETVLDDDTDEGNAAATAVPFVTTPTEPNIATTSESHTTSEANNVSMSNGANASPDPISESAAAARRGLRARRPAQQRPYSFDAQNFDEDGTEFEEEENTVLPSPSIQSRRVSVASIAHGPSEDQLDRETLAILQGEVNPDPEREEDDNGRPKHFKGKGRAWKKEESDEDLEFNPGKKKAARAKAKAKAQQQQQQPKKRGRPRKSNLSEDVIRDDSENEGATRTGDDSPSPAVSEGPSKKARKPPRKSVLSEELVRDDSDEDGEKSAINTPTVNATATEASTPAPKKRGRPRKSDQSASSKLSAGRNEEQKEIVSDTPKGTPNKPSTPKGTPNKSYTPKGSPKQSCTPTESPKQSYIPNDEPKEVEVSSLEVPPASKSTNEGLEPVINNESVVVSQPVTEPQVAAVNADDEPQVAVVNVGDEPQVAVVDAGDEPQVAIVNADNEKQLCE